QPVRTLSAPSSLSVPKSGEVWARLNRYLDESNPDRPKLSASALTTYLQSPLLFFLKYVAGIKEPHKVTEEFEMNRLGTVVHGAMQDVYEQLQAETDSITEKHIRAKLNVLPQICLQALSKELHGAAGKIRTPNSMQRILLKVAEE